MKTGRKERDPNEKDDLVEDEIEVNGVTYTLEPIGPRGGMQPVPHDTCMKIKIRLTGQSGEFFHDNKIINRFNYDGRMNNCQINNISTVLRDIGAFDKPKEARRWIKDEGLFTKLSAMKVKLDLKIKKSKEQTKTFIETIEEARDAIRAKIIESFPDETGCAWIHYQDEDKKRFHAVESESFADFIRVTLDALCGQPQDSWVESLVNLLGAEARRQPRRTLYLRTANIDGIWYIQENEDSCFKFENEKITEIESPPIFRQFSHQLPLVVDLSAKIADLDLIDPFTNFTDDWEKDMFKNTLPAYIVPGVAKPGQLTRGAPGGGKTTVNRLTKQIIDPTTTSQKGSSFPTKEGDWFVICRKNYAVFFDNLNKITKEQQDDCCRIITGMDVEKRKLYTDSDVVAATIQSILLINAIDLSDLNSDFLDRVFIWDLKRIDEANRKPEEDFWREFKKVQPRIMGAIFKILAKAQILAPSIAKIPDLRLKDFARYATACAMARGKSEDEFSDEINRKIELQKDETIAQSIIVSPIVNFMSLKNEWTGTAEELLKELTQQEYAQVVGTGDYEQKVLRNVPKEWPANATAFGVELKRVSFLLPRVNLTLDRLKGSKGIRKLILKKTKEL